MTGIVEDLHKTITNMQIRDIDAVWGNLAGHMDSGWVGVDRTVVAAFFQACRREWGQSPTPQRLHAFVTFLEEAYDEVVVIPPIVMERIILSVFTGDYSVFALIPRDTLLVLQMIVIAALTAHRGVRGDKLTLFLTQSTKPRAGGVTTTVKTPRKQGFAPKRRP
jgi:hypothetical protein